MMALSLASSLLNASVRSIRHPLNHVVSNASSQRLSVYACAAVQRCGSGPHTDSTTSVGVAPHAACQRRHVHTGVVHVVQQQAAKKRKGGKRGKSAREQGADKLFYTRIDLPSHQAYISTPGGSADDAPTLTQHGNTLTDGDDDAVAAANLGKNWTPESRRVGAITLKCGMTADWDVWGQRHPLTVLMLEDVQVTQVKPAATNSKTGLPTVQVGGGEAKPKSVTKPLAGHFAAAGVPAKLKLAEFTVTEDAVPAVGTRITARHFVPGQYVDVTATSIGKGFQGPMKRWGFGGQSASHGTTKAHRSHGSTGSSQNPGRVFKGKKMAGRMGGKTATVEGLQVYKIDVKRNLLYLRGSVPGHAGAYVRVRDSLRKPLKWAPPFPTYIPTTVDEERAVRWGKDDYDSAQQVASKRASGERYEREPPFELVMPAQDWDPFGIHDWEEPTMD